MKKIYNRSINYIISFVLAFPQITLIVLKYTLTVVAKLLKALRATVQLSGVFVEDLRDELIKILSVKG